MAIDLSRKKKEINGKLEAEFNMRGPVGDIMNSQGKGWVKLSGDNLGRIRVLDLILVDLLLKIFEVPEEKKGKTIFKNSYRTTSLENEESHQ